MVRPGAAPELQPLVFRGTGSVITPPGQWAHGEGRIK
jgi:hypothetical protein